MSQDSTLQQIASQMSDEAAPMVAYIYPSPAVRNRYLDKNITLWERCSLTVRDYQSISLIWALRRRHRNVAIIGWFEDWMLNAKRPTFINLVNAILVLAKIRLCCSHFIWIRHNFDAHSGQNPTWARRILISVLSAAAQVCVTHRKTSRIDSWCVPHPLVETIEEHSDQVRDIPYLWFGTVKSYKGLEKLIKEWPANRRLLIAGKCSDPALRTQLNGEISRRSDIEWQDRHLSNEELSDMLARTRYVLMAHEDAMIVSGSFYHAAGMGANIIVRDSQFARSVAQDFDFVTVYTDGRLPSALESTNYVSPARVSSQIQLKCGDDFVISAWNNVFWHLMPSAGTQLP